MIEVDPSAFQDLQGFIVAWADILHARPIHFRLEQRGTAQTNWYCRLYLEDGRVGYKEARSASEAISGALACAKAPQGGVSDGR